MEKATEVMPQRTVSCWYELSSRSARRSNSLHEASSEPVAKASPLGKNLKVSASYREVDETLLNSIDVRFMTGKGLDSLACPDVPDLCRGIACTRDEQVGVGCQGNAAWVSKAEVSRQGR